MLFPLPMRARRGDLLLNAAYATKKGYSMTLLQEDITPEKLVHDINELYENRDEFIARMKKDSTLDGTDEVLECIDKITGDNR